MTNSISNIRAIIFDMDGVLFLSGDSHERAFQEVLAGIGIAEFSYASIAGMRTDEALRQVILAQGLDVSRYDIAELVRIKRALSIRFLTENAKIAPGICTLLKKLSLQYRLALASSASPQTVKLFLQMSGCESVFDCCVDGSLVNDAKPSPEIYLLALQQLHMAPAECLVVEDALSGIQAAKDAGLRVIGLVGTESAATLLSAGVEAVLSDILELEGILMNA